MVGSDTINVVFITDDGYALPTGVAINSLRLNRNKDIVYDIYLLCNTVSEENKKRLTDLAENNFDVKIVDLGRDEALNQLKKSHLTVTSTALYKFTIPEILMDINKALYVDGDMILQSDLVELYNTEISSQYAAVVRNVPRKKALGGKRHSFYTEPSYFNTGMLLLNLELLREEKVSEKLIDYRLNGFNYFMDQDTFNVVFKGNVKYLSHKYNLLLNMLVPMTIKISNKEIADHYETALISNVDQYVDEAHIIHFTFAKPWKYYDVIQAEKWMNYLKSSTYSDAILNRMTFLSHFTESKSYRFGKIIMSLPKKIRYVVSNLSE